MTTPINPTRRALAACALLLAAGLAAPAVAQAKNKKRPSATSATSKTSRASKTKDSSDIQRRKLEDARLLRECRGRPNAGACLGYAS